MNVGVIAWGSRNVCCRPKSQGCGLPFKILRTWVVLWDPRSVGSGSQKFRDVALAPSGTILWSGYHVVSSICSRQTTLMSRRRVDQGSWKSACTMRSSCQHMDLHRHMKIVTHQLPPIPNVRSRHDQTWGIESAVTLIMHNKCWHWEGTHPS